MTAIFLESPSKGARFGAWEVLREASVGRYRKAVCKCRCGATRAVNLTDLYNGRSVSCGKRACWQPVREIGVAS